MTQRFSLWEDLTIRENLDFVARMYGMRGRRAVVVRAAVDGLGLGARRDQLAGQLSGGWKQRLALAACMLHEPQLLLLDEPTAGVDPKARRDFWDEIHALAGRASRCSSRRITWTRRSAATGWPISSTAAAGERDGGGGGASARARRLGGERSATLRAGRARCVRLPGVA